MGNIEWLPFSSAPKGDEYILAMVAYAPEQYAHLNGRPFSIRHGGATASDFDLGWNLYPGFGGVPDSWFSAWAEINPPGEANRGIPVFKVRDATDDVLGKDEG